MKPIRVLEDGDIHVLGFGVMLSNDWRFDMGDRPSPLSEKDKAEAIVVALNHVINKVSVSMGLVKTSSEPAPEPVSLQAERDAEMQAYMLINRCQDGSAGL